MDKSLVPRLLASCRNFCTTAIYNFPKRNTKRRKQMLNFERNSWWNLTCACTISLKFKFIFYCSHGKLFSVSFQVIIIYIFSMKKKHCKIYKVILELIFVYLKLKLRDFLSYFVLTRIAKDELERFRLTLSR